jgi:hypothetical protein
MDFVFGLIVCVLFVGAVVGLNIFNKGEVKNED